MKKICSALFLVLFASFCLHGQNCKKQVRKYLEPGSTLISCTGNTSFEKTEDGKFIYKVFYPEKELITQQISFRSRKKKKKDGPYLQIWDDGTIASKGRYENGQKTGVWIEADQQGNYIDDERQGVWKKYGEDSMIVRTQEYQDGQLHGLTIAYDTLGREKYRQVYELGVMISSSEDTLSDDRKDTQLVETLPRFPGCESLASMEEKDQCAQKKLLQYLYTRLKYPKKEKNNNIAGMAIVRFVVDKDGSITDIKMLNGVSAGIEAEVLRLIKNMPTWTPGTQNGKTVRVQFTLPINFKLT